MKYIILLVNLIFLISCNPKKKEQDNSLKGWILRNQQALMLDADTIIENYYSRNNLDSNWISSTIAITKYGTDGRYGPTPEHQSLN